MTLLALITFAVGLAAVAEDFVRRQISNWTSGAALALGLAVHASRGGWRGAVEAGAGAALGLRSSWSSTCFAAWAGEM